MGCHLREIGAPQKGPGRFWFGGRDRLARGMSDTLCPDCGGERVSTACADEMHLMRVTGWGMSVPLSSLRAVVCLSCGRAVMYVKDMDKVRQADRQYPDQFD